MSCGDAFPPSRALDIQLLHLQLSDLHPKLPNVNHLPYLRPRRRAACFWFFLLMDFARPLANCDLPRAQQSSSSSRAPSSFHGRTGQQVAIALPVGRRRLIETRTVEECGAVSHLALRSVRPREILANDDEAADGEAAQ